MRKTAAEIDYVCIGFIQHHISAASMSWDSVRLTGGGKIDQSSSTLLQYVSRNED